MNPVRYRDRETKKIEEEKVYGRFFLNLLYTNVFFSKCILPIVAQAPFFSKLYGMLQNTRRSARKIPRFIQKFHIDSGEFADPVSSYASFNAFFTRRLRPDARPVDSDPRKACLPADGRYLFFENIDEEKPFFIKGSRFHLTQFLQSTHLAARYKGGSMLIARLCPTDYHRFHFPCRCIPSETRPINGPLYSVNPVALATNPSIMWQNKRCITELTTEAFGCIQYVEVGATHVGSIHQTFTPDRIQDKGDEKGYFSFGGSSLVLLFEPGAIFFDDDLLDAGDTEVRGKFGQSLGVSGIG